MKKVKGAPMQATTRCQVCHSEDLVEVLNIGLHPLCDDLVEVGDARICKEYPIEILLCKECLTANQRYNVEQTELFPESYHYRARFTQDVLNGMESLVQEVIDFCGSIENKKVLDVGCNDASLLGFFKAKGAQTYGVEPTGAYKDAAKGHNKLWGGVYFGQEAAKTVLDTAGKMDFITFTNVFAHIEDFDDLVEGVTLLAHTDTKVIVENHYLGAVLDRNQFDTFYHEHPRTYSLRSFHFIAKRLGMNIESIEFPKRYGGNIRVIMGTGAPSQASEDRIKAEDAYFDQFADMQKFVDSWKEEKLAEINALVAEHGPILAKAFPGRAAILIKLLGLSEKQIARVAEKPGSMKIGHYLPGTRIPIVSDDDCNFAYEPVMLNLAWHIGTEIEGYLRSKGFAGKLTNIL